MSANYKIWNVLPEMYPRIVQIINGLLYDGNGNLINLNITSTSGGTSSGPTYSFDNAFSVSSGLTVSLASIPAYSVIANSTNSFSEPLSYVGYSTSSIVNTLVLRDSLGNLYGNKLFINALQITNISGTLSSLNNYLVADTHGNVYTQSIGIYLTSSALIGYLTQSALIPYTLLSDYTGTVSNIYVTLSNYLTSSALSSYVLSSNYTGTVSNIYATLSNYLTSSALTGYLTSSALIPYVLNSNYTGTVSNIYVTLSNYLTSSALIPYVLNSNYTGTVSNIYVTLSNYLTSSALTGYLTASSLSIFLTGGFGATITGIGGSQITTGYVVATTIPYNMTITKWNIVSTNSAGLLTGSIVIDIRDSSGTSLVGGGNSPTLSSATSSNANVSGWTTTVVASGTILQFYVSSVTTCTNVTAQIIGNKS